MGPPNRPLFPPPLRGKSPPPPPPLWPLSLLSHFEWHSIWSVSDVLDRAIHRWASEVREDINCHNSKNALLPSSNHVDTLHHQPAEVTDMCNVPDKLMFSIIALNQIKKPLHVKVFASTGLSDLQSLLKVEHLAKTKAFIFCVLS